MGMAPLRLVTCIFQAIFSCSFYLRGRFFSGLVPFKSGPRHRAHSAPVAQREDTSSREEPQSCFFMGKV
jgi:hypothetical protein